ncbi:Metalloreductase steap4 [Chytridiales sp. JEL 0842]|nr:Metalloreductase steap4 [Chytridiales sp. JEL 0842]
MNRKESSSSIATALLRKNTQDSSSVSSTMRAPSPQVPQVVAVIGTGWFGREFAKRCLRFDVQTFIGSRTPDILAQNMQSDIPNADQVVTFIDEAIRQADIVVLAIPHTAHTPFARIYAQVLSNKLIIDVSNGAPSKSNNSLNGQPLSIAENLELLLREYTPSHLPPPRVAKAFNTIAAYALGSTSSTSSENICICTNNPTDTQTITALARSIGFPSHTVTDSGPLLSAHSIEKIPFTFFKDWHSALWASLVTWIFFIIWVTLRYNIYSAAEFPWHHFTNQVTDKAMAALSLSMLAYTYLPGCIAESINLYAHFTSQRIPLPSWLISFLNARKQLGLLALYWGVLHTLQALIILHPGSFPKYYDPVTATVPFPRFNGLGEAGMFLGVLGLFGMMTQGITSIPSVQSAMSWAEFHFIQTWIGWFALLTSTLHVVLPSYNAWLTPSTWPGGMPGTTIMSTIIPMAVCLFKVVLVLAQGVKWVSMNAKSGSGKMGAEAQYQRTVNSMSV